MEKWAAEKSRGRERDERRRSGKKKYAKNKNRSGIAAKVARNVLFSVGKSFRSAFHFHFALIHGDDPWSAEKMKNENILFLSVLRCSRFPRISTVFSYFVGATPTANANFFPTEEIQNSILFFMMASHARKQTCFFAMQMVTSLFPPRLVPAAQPPGKHQTNWRFNLSKHGSSADGDGGGGESKLLPFKWCHPL